MVISATHNATRCLNAAKKADHQQTIRVVAIRITADAIATIRKRPTRRVESSIALDRNTKRSFSVLAARPSKRSGRKATITIRPESWVAAACCRITRLKARSNSDRLSTADCSSPNSRNSAHMSENFSDRKISRKQLSAINLSVTESSGRMDFCRAQKTK